MICPELVDQLRFYLLLHVIKQNFSEFLGIIIDTRAVFKSVMKLHRS